MSNDGCFVTFRNQFSALRIACLAALVAASMGLAGCGGRAPKSGLKLDRIFTEDEVLAAIGKIVKFFKEFRKCD